MPAACFIFVSVQQCGAETLFFGVPLVALRFSALSSNSPGSRPFKPRDAGATPVEAAIFLKEAPVLDPRPEAALPSRIRMKPAGGPSPAGAEFILRSWRKSNAPVCQSGVGSASLPERTNWSCGVQ